MNHLCGLPHLNNDDSQVATHPYEQETLAAFRQRFYDSAPPIEEYRSNNTIADYDVDAGEEKKDS
eukprot:scaffold4778_cov100-Skeletonema_dohrnii-CCMP3373.AAC.1